MSSYAAKKTHISCPAWLALSKDRLSFVYLPDRALIVREIFDEAISGIGAESIVRRLIERNVAPFGNVAWQQSTISALLTNRAVLGEYQKKILRNGKRLVIGDPIPNFYPAVLNEAVFDAAQAARQQNFLLGRGGKGAFVTNLFAGIIFCAYCGAPMKTENRTFNPNKKLGVQNFVCKNAFKTRDCVATRWPRQKLEDAFFSCVAQVSRDLSIQGDKTAIVPGTVRDQSTDDLYKRRSAISSKIKTAIAAVRVGALGHEDLSSVRRTRIENLSYVAKSRYIEVEWRSGERYMFFPETGLAEMVRR
jgi:hypothetical protein